MSRLTFLVPIACLAGVLSARAQDPGVTFTILDSPPLEAILVEPLTPTNAKATKLAGTAILVRDGSDVPLAVKRKINTRKGTSVYKLRSPGSGLPKLRGKIKVGGDPAVVTKAKLVFTIAKREKIKVRDPGKVLAGPRVPSTTTTTIAATTTTMPGSTTTTLVTTTSTSSTTSTTLYASFADAPPEVLQRLDEVLAAARAVLNGGGTFDEVIALLATEPDVTKVVVDGLTLEFSVAGLETALHDGQAARLGGPPPAAAPAGARTPTSAAASIVPIPVVEAAAVPPVGQRMLGDDRDFDGRRDIAKKALVLSPYKFQFQDTDDGQPVADILKGRADYAAGVEYHPVATKGPGLLSMTLWTSWMNYDVIHIVTHGERNRLWLGDSTSSCTTLAATIRSEVPAAADRVGLRCGSVNTAPANAAPVWDTDVSVDPSFFARHYPGGLPKRFVFLNACRTTFAPGMAQALLGDDTIYLGWDEYVDSQLALDTALALYQDMVGLGFPAWRAFVRTCTGGKCINMRTRLPSGQTKNEELEIAYDRADLRLRESLGVIPPFLTGVCLEVPDVPLEFSCPSCVNPEVGVFVGFDVILEGFVPEDMALRTDPFEFAIQQLRVFADVDDEDSGYALPIISNDNTQLVDLGDGTWQSPVTLYVPNVCPNDVVSYLPKLMLPAYDPNAGGLRDFSYPVNGPWDLSFDTPPL